MKSGIRLQPLREVTRALFAFVFFFGMSWSTSAESEKPLSAIFLVARSELSDPLFKDSIVLVMNNVGPLPAGVILNRPTRISVSDLFPDFQRLAQLQDKVYLGGPVELRSVWYLFRADAQPQHSIRVLDGVYVSTNRDLLHKLLGRDKPTEGLRIFIGHSSWAPGQLEGEIARGDWTLAPADKDAIFNGKFEHPWPEEEDVPDAARHT